MAVHFMNYRMSLPEHIKMVDFNEQGRGQKPPSLFDYKYSCVNDYF